MTRQLNKKCNKNILVAIPVYNEEKYVDEILTAVSSYSSNILVVNDGSYDETGKLLESYESVKVITHGTNEGYGQSLIDAFEYAKDKCYKWVITMDCDCQHQPSCIPHFLDHIEKDDVDIISGSRYLLADNFENVPAERLRINRCITSLLNSALKINITDAFCGFKAYRVDALKKLKLTEKGYGMPLQLWIKAASANLNITEIPVPLIYHDPKRNFSGMMELPKSRLQYYMSIIEKELVQI